MPLTQRPFSINCYLLPKAWYRCHILPLRRGDIDNMKKVLNRFLYSDQLEKPNDVIKYRPRCQGGLQLHNIDCKSRAMLIKTFLELATNPDFKNSLFYSALFEHYVLKNTSTTSPKCPPFCNQHFFDTIKNAMNENCVANWSSKQWYGYLLDRNTLQQETNDEDGRICWESIKCPVEIAFANYDWNLTWARARMPGLSNEVRSFLWKYCHNLLPTQSRLSRITRTVENPACIHCDTGEEDHAWYHTFASCSASKPIIDWLLETLNSIPIQFDSIEEVLWLQFSPLIYDIDLLTAIWLVGETLAYTWARRKNRENINIPAHTAILRIKASHMAISEKHHQCGKDIYRLLGP